MSERRKNGLEFPPHPFQVITWFLFPLIVLQYYLFLMPLLWNIISQIILSIIFGISMFISCYYGYITCSIDPCDNALMRTTSPINETDIYCYLCEVNV